MEIERITLAETPPMYAELHCHSNFSFLRGGSHPEELVERAVALGLYALALTDSNGLYGAVRFHQAAKRAGLKAIIGAEIDLAGGARVVLLARDGEGYRNLSSLLTQTLMGSPRLEPRAEEDLLWRHAQGLVLLAGHSSPPQQALATGDERAAAQWLARAQEAFGRRHVLLEGRRHLRAGDEAHFAKLRAFAQTHGFAGVVSNAVRYATAGDRTVYDTLTCVREHTTLEKAGILLEPNAERRLKGDDDMRHLFSDAQDWVQRCIEIAQLCAFDMDELHYRLPAFDTGSQTPEAKLAEEVNAGAERRYGTPVPEAARRQLDHELGVIAQLGFAGYFLIVWDVVRFCNEKRILCQGRGSAANSAVCYCLGITAIDPVGMGLLFERFLSAGRSEPPDIDLDIAHHYREEVIQYVYQKYGREYAGMVCEVITYKGRSAIRDVGKALGLSLDQVDRIAKHLPMHHAFEKMTDVDNDLLERLRREWGVDPESKSIAILLNLVDRLDGFPRHLSIHVGGMVISAEPLGTMVPVEPAAMNERTVIQWDKDDSADAGMVKIDLLGLGMLTLLQDGFKLIEEQHGKRYALHELGYDDAEVFDLLCRADTIGVFQVESRAQMNCLPRLKPRCFYDLVVEVALIRPGPIQGEMVHPYLRRRAGEEPVTYPHPDLVPILSRTLGVPLFQEQGMRVAVTAAGFTAVEADDLRRAMNHKRSRVRMHTLLAKLVRGMEANGYPDKAIDRIVKQLTAFADYGFPESHAASFAILVYASAWMKRRYPTAFYVALLNAQPMGFYSPATIVSDAQRHGVEVRPPDLRHSRYDSSVEEAAVRLGLRTVRGIGEAYRETLEQVMNGRPFAGLESALDALDVLPVNLRRNLIAAGALDGFGQNRREARWALEKRNRPPAGPLAPAGQEAPASFEPLSRVEEMQADYGLTGLSVKHQPVSFYRKYLRGLRCKTAHELSSAPNGSRVRIGGLVICRQRPGTAKGMLFITLEDETGLANIVVFPNMLEKARTLWVRTPLILVTGKLEREHSVTNVIAQSVEALPPLEERGGQLSFAARDFR